MSQTKTILKRSTRILAGNVPADGNDGRVKAVQLYEAALKLMQQGKYEQAHTAFNNMLANSPGDLADRIRVYVNACLQHLGHNGSAEFKTCEEHYDFAISLLNDGSYKEAQHHLEAVLRDKSNADYAFYGLALLASITGDSQHCLEHLTEAIRLNPKNRIQARADSDFQDMADDPRFTELLYPEV